MKIAIILTAIDKMSSVIDKAINRSSRKLKTIEKLHAGLNNLGDKAIIAGGVSTAFFASTINAAEESEKAARISERIWRNQGDITGAAAKSAEEYAKTLAPLIGIAHEKIQAVESQLAVYRNVSDQVARDKHERLLESRTPFLRQPLC